MNSRWRWMRHPVVRFGAGIVTAMLAGVAAALVVYQASVQPGAAIVKAVFERGPLVTPPSDFAQVARSVTERTITLSAAGAPAADLVIYTPAVASARPRPVILWIHGGGFISSSPATVADYSVMLAHAGYTVASLGYSLAPGARYPVPIRQGNAALAFLRTSAPRFGGDPSRIVLGGDSAGAQIASELAAVQTDPALARSIGLSAAVPRGALRGAVLFCGLYDMRTVASTGFPALRTYLWAYTGVRDWTSYSGIDQLSTVRHITPAFPPTFISVGDADPLQSQANELVAALKQSNVPVTTLFWWGTGDHLNHEYQFKLNLLQARTAFQRVLTFLGNVSRS